jgi:SAM-dependent methyltransferase
MPDLQNTKAPEAHNIEGVGMARPEEVVNLDQGNQGVGLEDVIYTRRFSSAEEETRASTWKVLTEKFFQNYISADDVVVDVGAGDGLFITNVKAKERIAVDLSPHVQKLEQQGIRVIQSPATAFAENLPAKADVIFMSNFLEHLPDKKVLLDVLKEAQRALRPGGTIMILQPNIRYVGSAYWDYIDHHIALTEHSLVEALEVTGYTVAELVPQFLPYTAKSLLGKFTSVFGGPAFIEQYLRFPFLWKIFGKQTFVVATYGEKVGDGISTDSK